MWSEPLHSLAGGVLWADTDTDMAALLDDLDEHWLKAHCLVPSDATKKSVIAQIGAALDFPEWAGSNLDALYELLTDMSWLDDEAHVMLVLDRGPSFNTATMDGWQQITQVLIDAATFWLPEPRIFIAAIR